MLKVLKNKSGMMFLIVLGIVGLSMGFAMGTDDADIGQQKISDGARPVRIEGAIMAMIPGNKSFMMSEMGIVMGPFSVKGKVQNTRLLNEHGNETGVDALKVHQWVVVNGYKVGSSTVFAEKVQIVPNQLQKSDQSIQKVAPIQ